MTIGPSIARKLERAPGLGARLTACRMALGYLQEEVAQELKVSVSSIARWETDARRPSLRWLIKLADYYTKKLKAEAPTQPMVTIDWFVGRTTEGGPQPRAEVAPAAEQQPGAPESEATPYRKPLPF